MATRPSEESGRLTGSERLRTGSKRLLTGTDRISALLLTTVSGHVEPKTRRHFAMSELGLGSVQVSNIEEDKKGHSLEVSLEILEKWLWKDSSINVSVLMKKLDAWIRAGYVSNEVWSYVETLVNPEVIPAHPVTPAPSGASSGNIDDESLVGVGARLKTSRVNYKIPTGSEAEDLQDRAKDSIERQYRRLDANDWLRSDKAKSVPVTKYYVDLKWMKLVKDLEDSGVNISTIYDILKVLDSKPKALNILIEAEPGMGKTWSMALLALEWAAGEEEADKRLLSIDYTFMVRLRDVDKISSLAETIIAQHDQFDEEDKEHLTAILKGKTNHRVMILMDGYDEYKPGTNSDIDRAIDCTVGKCMIILTSRPGYLNKKSRNKLDGEILIQGFSPENIRKFSRLYLGSDEETDEMLEQAKKSGINDIIHVPIILLIVCFLFREEKSLPKTQTEIFTTVHRLIMDRTTKKTMDCKSSEIPNLDELLYKLGELSWNSLKNDVQQLLLKKDDVPEDIKKLGLLFETGADVASVTERPTYVTFHHKLLQEYSGGYFICRRLEKSHNKKELCCLFFPTWEDIEKHQEVILFAHGLMADPAPLVHHVYQMCVEVNREEIGKGDTNFKNVNKLFKTFYSEAKTPLPGSPYHNQYINYYNHQKFPLDVTPIYVPSKIYWFDNINDVLFLNESENVFNYAEVEHSMDCLMVLTMLAFREMTPSDERFLEICRRISRNQPIRDLRLDLVKVENQTDGDIFYLSPKYTTAIQLFYCKLRPEVAHHLFRQISRCRNLTVLHCRDCNFDLQDIDLSQLKKLKHLRFDNVRTHPEICAKICWQLKYLDNLEVVELSGIALEHPSLITEAIKAWGESAKLKEISLCYISIPAETLTQLMGALLRCKQLEKISIEHVRPEDQEGTMRRFPYIFLLWKVSKTPLIATLKLLWDKVLETAAGVQIGFLKMFLTKPYCRLPNLNSLFLQTTYPTENDLKHLTRLLEEDKLPRLDHISLENNRLGRMEPLMKDLVHTFLVNAMRNNNQCPKLELKFNAFSEDFRNFLDKLDGIAGIKISY